MAWLQSSYDSIVITHYLFGIKFKLSYNIIFSLIYSRISNCGHQLMGHTSAWPSDCNAAAPCIIAYFLVTLFLIISDDEVQLLYSKVATVGHFDIII